MNISGSLPSYYGSVSAFSTDGKTEAQKGISSGGEECQTCKNRKYQDGSNENVSFKSAQHMSPTSAGARVRAHEAEHVSNAYTKAAEDGGTVLQASVKIQTSVCPECGRTYVSGGTTTTKIAYPNESNPYQQEKKSQDAGDLIGAHFSTEV